MSDNTFATKDPKTVAFASNAMRCGLVKDWEIGTEPIRGKVVRIERLDDGEFQITVRE